MRITYRTRQLEKQYGDHRRATKAYGEQVAQRYIQRINILKSAQDFDTVKKLPGLDCHPLTGNRKGQWAIKLTGFSRLICSLKGDKLDVVCIEEVSKHYDD